MADEDKKPHLCTMCHMAFLGKDELRTHVISQHTEHGRLKEDPGFSEENVPVNDIELTGQSMLKCEDSSSDNKILNAAMDRNFEDPCPDVTDNQSFHLTSYDRVYFHNQELLDLPQHVQNVLLQCKICHFIFNSPKHLEDHMLTHDNSQDLIQDIKHEKDTPVITGSCYVNVFAASNQNSVQPLANFSDPELSFNEDGDLTFDPEEGEDTDGGSKDDFSSQDERNSDIDYVVPSRLIKKRKNKIPRWKKILECKICKLVFEEEKELKVHQSTHEEKSVTSKLVECKECDQIFTTHYKLEKHIEKEHKDIKVKHQCPKCSKLFATNARFKKHMAEHHKNEDNGDKKPFQCSVCDKQFATGNHLKQHEMIHTGFRPYQCSQCGKGFIKRADLLRHETTHSDVKPYLCSLCAKGFGTSCQLKFHMMRHSGETPFTCMTCGKGFIARKYLRRHEQLHSGKKPFLCNLCGRGLSSRKRLKAHIMLHSGEKAFPCKQCEKSYTSKHHLEKHMIVHTEGPYICTICNRECRGKGNLERHIKSCSGQTRHLLEKFKDVECPYCKRTFKKHNLKQHIRIHTGEKPFACEKCNKAYKRNYLLEEHMRTHSGEKPFVCPECGKAFARKLNMQVHMRTHFGEKHVARARNYEAASHTVMKERQATTVSLAKETPEEGRYSASPTTQIT